MCSHVCHTDYCTVALSHTLATTIYCDSCDKSGAGLNLHIASVHWSQYIAMTLIVPIDSGTPGI